MLLLVEINGDININEDLIIILSIYLYHNSLVQFLDLSFTVYSTFTVRLQYVYSTFTVRLQYVYRMLLVILV